MSESQKPSVPVPFLAGPRVRLQPHSSVDVPVAVSRWNDPVVRHYARATYPITVEARKKQLADLGDISQKSDSIGFAIWLNAEERVIGDCGINNISWTDRNAWIGMNIGDKSCWGQGIAVDAGTLLLDYAFGELDLHKLIAGIYMPNARSQGVARKGGLACIGVLHDHVFVDGHYIDSCIFEIFRDEWTSRRASILEAILPP
jgi:[ribosomal protein S5]-alanine N-acetyltransferase